MLRCTASLFSMGYDLHITRAELWTESEDRPISQAEWQTVVDSRGDLGPDGSGFVLQLPMGTAIFMRWWDGQITVNKPFGRDKTLDDLVTDALVGLATDANAYLQGDDWEVYERSASDGRGNPVDTSD